MPPDLSQLPEAGQLFAGDLESGNAASLPQRVAAESRRVFERLQRESFYYILFGCT